MDTSASSRDEWFDILSHRRQSSDLLWLTFHTWSASQYKSSKNRNYIDERKDVFKNPVIQALLLESGNNRMRIESILDEMCHSWSLPTIRFVGFFVTKIMKSIYRHVWINDFIEIPRDFPLSIPPSESSLKKVLNSIAAECPVLLMPTHRSYADFIIFSYLCFDLNLPLPSIAAGIDFLSLNQVASLLRSCGAFFIRRSFKDDSVYWATFTAYVESLIEGGERPVEFFVEGTRSRSGKSLPPKTGLLGVALNLFLSGRLTDLVIIPVAISYDRTLEEELYAKELAAPDFITSSNCGTKPKETTTHLISGARKVLSQDFGSIHLQFAPPVSVRNLSHSFVGGDVRLQSRRARCNTSVVKSFVDFVAKRVICLQVDNLVLSSFPFLAIIALTSDFSHKPFVFVNSGEMLNELEKLASLVPNQCLSYRNLNIDLIDDFKECLEVHNKLMWGRNSQIEEFEWPSSPSLDLALRTDSLTVIQLHHYANQALQLLIDLAIVCFSSCDWIKYKSIKRLLSNEFVFCESDMEDKFSENCFKFVTLNDKTVTTLNFHIEFFLKSYLDTTQVLLNNLQLVTGPQKLTIKQLVTEIQHDLDLASDLISNAVNLMVSRSILHRDEKNLLSLGNKAELEELRQEISCLKSQQVSRQPRAKL